MEDGDPNEDDDNDDKTEDQEWSTCLTKARKARDLLVSSQANLQEDMAKAASCQRLSKGTKKDADTLLSKAKAMEKKCKDLLLKGKKALSLTKAKGLDPGCHHTEQGAEGSEEGDLSCGKQSLLQGRNSQVILGKVALPLTKRSQQPWQKGSLGAHVFEQLQDRPSCVLKKNAAGLQPGCKVITPKNPQEEWCCFCVFWVLKGFVVVQRVDVWGMLS